MGITSTRKHDKYDTKYPDGYNLVELDYDDPQNEILFAKYKEFQDTAKSTE